MTNNTKNKYGCVEHGLIVLQPFADKIINGEKQEEYRTKEPLQFGRIFLSTRRSFLWQ